MQGMDYHGAAIAVHYCLSRLSDRMLYKETSPIEYDICHSWKDRQSAYTCVGADGATHAPQVLAYRYVSRAISIDS